MANAHGTGYASFTFKVSDGVSESAVVNTMTVDVTAVNDPATGLPTITGTAREGQTLTAEASAIADVDGLPAVSAFVWQWLRVNGGTEVEIQGATSKTYRVVAADVGAKFKVRVSFTDLDGNAESLTSAAVYPVDTVGRGERGADVGGPDGDDGRGHGIPVRAGGLCLYGHGLG